MTFLSLTLDNIKTQGLSSQNIANAQKTNFSTNQIFNFNNNLYSIEDNNDSKTPEQIKENYQKKISMLNTSVNEALSDMDKKVDDNIKTANDNIQKLDEIINRMDTNILNLKTKLQMEENKTPQNTNTIEQLKKEIECEEKKLKQITQEKFKNLKEIVFWTEVNKQYKANINIWLTANKSQLEKECEQVLQNYEQNKTLSNFTPVETVSKKNINNSLIELKKINAEYNSKPTTENKTKLAAQIKTVQTIFGTNAKELNNQGIYTNIQQMMFNILNRLEIKL